MRERSGVAVDVLTGEEEARLAFGGATRMHPAPLPGPVAVVDVGGGSCEVAVGTKAGGVTWSASLTIGSGSLAESCLRSDPPLPEELDEVLRQAAAAFAGLDIPPVADAIAVGGSATSTARLVGPWIDAEHVAEAMRKLCCHPSEEVGREHGLDPERVRLLPAGLRLLEAAAGRLGCALAVGRGGLREGACIELAGPH